MLRLGFCLCRIFGGSVSPITPPPDVEPLTWDQTDITFDATDVTWDQTEE